MYWRCTLVTHLTDSQKQILTHFEMLLKDAAEKIEEELKQAREALNVQNISTTVDRMCRQIENFQFPEPYERERQYHRTIGYWSVSGPRDVNKRRI